MDRTEWADKPVVAPHGKGVAIFRAAPKGLRCELSPDGVRWQTEDAESERAGALRPVCPAEQFGEAQVLCADGEGRLLGVSAAERRLSLQAAFRPEFSTERWYEKPPAPGELAIVRDRERGVYRAFFSARRKSGRHADRRGCIGSATSADLRAWDTEPPILAPNLFQDLRAPRVLNDGERHVLFYATPEEGGLLGLRAAIAPHLEGPYERLEPDLIACDARTGAQPAHLGPRRLLFFDRQMPDGSPGVSRPGLLEFRAGGRPFVRFYEPLLGLLGRTLFQTDVKLSSSETLVRVMPRFGTDFRLTLKLRSRGARAAGALFRTSMTGHDNVTLWLDFAAGAALLRRGVNGRLLARVPRKLAAEEDHRVSLWVEGPFADVYLDDEWILTCATEGRTSGGFGLTTLGGEARFEAVTAQAIQA